MSLPPDVQAILGSAITAVSPRDVCARSLSLEAGGLLVDGRKVVPGAPEHVYVLGAGKAAATMASALEESAGTWITAGCVVVPYGHAVACGRVQVLEAGHPVVDEMGVAATAEVLRLAGEAGERDLVICLLSGGGSALLEKLPPGITLQDLQHTSRLLIASGANIEEINTVRRHTSLVKGGQLARVIAPARHVSLVISDVIGDSPEAIASGPTTADPSTFADACAVLERRALMGRVPPGVQRHLQDGALGLQPETPKPGDPVFRHGSYHVLANNAAAVAAAAREAAARGFRPLTVRTGLSGEARNAGSAVAFAVRESLKREQPGRLPSCLLWGGETTVTVRGQGRGGRNQEVALAAFKALQGTEGQFVVAALGTDGTDGPTDAAGAWFDRRMIAAAHGEGIEPDAFLENNDSYSFFARLGGLLRTGPTGTNVADLVLALVW